MTTTAVRPAPTYYSPNARQVTAGGFTAAGGLLALIATTSAGLNPLGSIAAFGPFAVAAFLLLPNDQPWWAGRWAVAAEYAGVLLGFVILFLGITAVGSASQGDAVVTSSAQFLVLWVLLALGPLTVAIRYANRAGWRRG